MEWRNLTVSKRSLLVFVMAACLGTMVIGCSQGTDIVSPEDLKANMSSLPPEEQTLVAAETGDANVMQSLLQSFTAAAPAK